MEACLADRRINLKQLVERLQLLRCQPFDQRILRATTSYGAGRKPNSLDDLHRRQIAAASIADDSPARRS